MTRLLVTGADGFVGRWLIRAARRDGIAVEAAIHPQASPLAEWSDTDAGPRVNVVRADFAERDDVERLGELDADAVVHLAAIASGNAARRDPEAAHHINTVMTGYFAEQVLTRRPDARFLFISSGEVYGAGHCTAISESAPLAPVSPYAASKAEAEDALRTLEARLGAAVVIARAFPHTGPEQSTQYVLPALAARLREAKLQGASTVSTGNLDAVRDFLDVRDVVNAYLLLLSRGRRGDVYNVASGVGQRLSDCFARLREIVGADADPVVDAALTRPSDIPVLIGNSSRLRDTTGWTPHIDFDRTLQDLVDAQAH